MTKTTGSEITRILADLRGVDRKEVLERLLPVVYRELHGLARAQLRHERPDHTLQRTALVHEAYLRMLGGQSPPWNDRAHFFRAAAEAMRRILVDHARKHRRAKRGGGRVRVSLSGLNLGAAEDLDTILALDEALERLDRQDPRVADVVRLRFFARAWLYDALRGAEG